MKILHTADWHVGKVLKGRSRTEEHTAVLRELIGIARREDVDLVIVAGDVFDTSAPPPEAQALVMPALMALREGGRDVVVLAGNHDNPRLLDVYRPVLGALGIHVVGGFRRPDKGGVISFTARGGEPVRLAVLPFLSHRYVVRAAEALTGTAAEHNRGYAERFAELTAALTADFAADTVNLVATHATLPGGKFGGGEREAQSIFSYYVEPSAFPPATQYAALGHLHRRQRIDGPCPIWYSGSPLAVDFGEEGNTPGALLVTVEPGVPAVVREAPIGSARRLLTVRGSLEELAARREELGEAWLRVVVAEKPRPGLADTVRELLPGALQVDVDERFRPTEHLRSRAEGGRVRGPRELFRDYLAASGKEDPGSRPCSTGCTMR
ncbi:exonuclease SbcCD subunit D [Thermocatellispora tengchongensis]|uniref:exonuclease SbcCD subunit D n=1 Tax=Thermocatellispora tengchongensis TaxID=1073253 RepID=UPI00362C480E